MGMDMKFGTRTRELLVRGVGGDGYEMLGQEHYGSSKNTATKGNINIQRKSNFSSERREANEIQTRFSPLKCAVL